MWNNKQMTIYRLSRNENVFVIITGFTLDFQESEIKSGCPYCMKTYNLYKCQSSI